MLRLIKNILSPLYICWFNTWNMVFCTIKILFAYILSSRIDSNSIFFASMSSTCYGGNPKAFCDYIRKNRNGKYKYYWSFQNPDTINSGSDVTKVKLHSFKYYRALFSSKYIISDYRLGKYSFPYKKKNQRYIQTWHGTAIKQVEAAGHIGSIPESHLKNAKHDSSMIDIFVSGSKFMKNYYEKYFWYNGIVDLIGTPRNDIFFNDNAELKTSICTDLNIPTYNKILLFAPTFRNTGCRLDIYKPDLKKITGALKAKFGGDWTILVRLHPNLIGDKKYAEIVPDYSIDATLYPDMQDLLAISDILITDYSSSFFDFSLTKRPCFLYGIDYTEYDRGFTMDINSLPYPFAKTEEELMKYISEYNKEEAIKRIKTFNNRIGMFEDGNSCERLCKMLDI